VRTGVRDRFLAFRLEGAVGKITQKRDRKASIPGKRSRGRREGAGTKSEECAHRLQRSEGRLKKVEANAAARLLMEDALNGDMGALCLLIGMVEGEKKPVVKEKVRRVQPVRTWLLRPEWMNDPDFD
jgi:hypothetical protein